MRVLFLTMVWPNSPKASNMYTDLMSEFVEEKHDVTILALNEARNKMPTALTEENGMRVLRVKCGNIQKTNKYKKVISSMLANVHILLAAKKYLNHEKFDLLLFALPPATTAPAVCKLKKEFDAKLYLLLKEFWPQDPADMGAMSKGGMVWKFFEVLSNKLYASSDYIGTMSNAGIDFLQNNVKCSISGEIETCPNCLKDNGFEQSSIESRKKLFEEYGIPLDKIVCIFGGNLGVSQGIPEMVASLKSMSDSTKLHFLIIGAGTEADKVKKSLESQRNVQIFDWIPSKDYEEIVKSVDIGMIFLFPEYTVPNIPSRLVGYLKYGLPVMACIDKTTDLGMIIENNNCGYYVRNGDIVSFKEKMNMLCNMQTRSVMSENSRKLFKMEYTSKRCYEIIAAHFIDE